MHDWDDLRHFQAAFQAGSFTRAARRLAVQQSTVSRRVAALEAQIGGALFIRQRGGLVPTDLAHQLIVVVRQMADVAAQVPAVVTGRPHQAEGTVRVALTDGFAELALVPILPALLAAHPALRIELLASPQVVDLARGEADVALRFTQPHGEALVARRLGALPLAVVCAPALADCPWAALPWVALHTPGVFTPLDAWTDAHAPRPVVRATSYAATLAAVRVGLGAALLTAAVAQVVPGVVVRLAPVPLPPPLPLWLVAHAAARPLRRVEVVWEALVQWAADNGIGQVGPTV